MDWKTLESSVFYTDPKKDHEIDLLMKTHEDFQEDLGDLEKDRKKLLRFIILMYDMNTPLRNAYRNYFTRKGQAALMAGFKRDKQTGKFKEAVKDAMLGKNDIVNGMIVRYVMNFYNEDYLNLILYWELFGKFGREQMTKSSISPQQVNAMDSMKKTINDLTQKIFGGDESRELTKELYRALEMESESLNPDNVAWELKRNPNFMKENYE